MIARSLLVASLLALFASAGPALADTVQLRAAPLDPVTFVPDLGDEKGFLGRRAAHPLPRLELFAERRELALGVRTSMFDLEGGAELELLRNLHLTGGFRLLDYELSDDASGLVAQHAGPYFGISLSF